MLRLYGIPNCDTIRKTKKLLDRHDIPFQFIDVRATPLSPGKLKEISVRLGLMKLINRRGRTYRDLGIKEKSLSDDQLLDILQQNQAMIKRPLLENNNNYYIGYDEQGLLDFARLV